MRAGKLWGQKNCRALKAPQRAPSLQKAMLLYSWNKDVNSHVQYFLSISLCLISKENNLKIFHKKINKQPLHSKFISPQTTNEVEHQSTYEYFYFMCVCAQFMSCASRGQKTLLDPLKLQL